MHYLGGQALAADRPVAALDLVDDAPGVRAMSIAGPSNPL
jgi:hypothetical protein